MRSRVEAQHLRARVGSADQLRRNVLFFVLVLGVEEKHVMAVVPEDTFNNKPRTYLVYHCTEMGWLADELVRREPKRFSKRRIDWHSFPDGTPNVFIHNINDCANRHVLFLASWSSQKEKDYQYKAMYVFARTPRVRTITVVLPFFPSATMERVDREGTVAAADIDAHLMDTLPAPKSSITLIMYDIHTLQNRFYFRNTCCPLLVSAVPLFKTKLLALKIPIKEFCIAFPDAGAAKRFSKFFRNPAYETIVCGKIRDGDRRKVIIQEGCAKGKHAFIVDDLVQTGGTLLACRDALIQDGATAVSCYVTHAVFPNGAHKKFTTPGLFQHFFITNSVPKTAQRLEGVKPFQIISLADSLLPTASHLKPYL